MAIQTHVFGAVRPPSVASRLERLIGECKLHRLGPGPEASELSFVAQWSQSRKKCPLTE